MPPGGDELFSLLALKAHHESGDWDVIVVDCAPTGETLRLLSFPDAAQWWLDKVLGRERALLAAARPLARTFLDSSSPTSARSARSSGWWRTWSRCTTCCATPSARRSGS